MSEPATITFTPSTGWGEIIAGLIELAPGGKRQSRMTYRQIGEALWLGEPRPPRKSKGWRRRVRREKALKRKKSPAAR